MQPGTGLREATEDHARQRRRCGQRIGDGCDRDSGCAISRETVDASGNRRECDRGQAIRLTQLQRAAIAGGEQFVLALPAAVPNRSNGMDHVLGLQPITSGDFGVAGVAAVQCAAFGKQFGPRGPMDRAIDAAPAKERRIGGVDDGINAQCRDIGDDDFEPRRAELARDQAQTAALTATPLSANSCCNSPAWNISRMMSQPPTNSPLT